MGGRRPTKPSTVQLAGDSRPLFKHELSKNLRHVELSANELPPAAKLAKR
jgi:hypothetical protein